MDYEYSDAVKNITPEPVEGNWRYETVCDECGSKVNTLKLESDHGFLQIDYGLAIDVNGGYGMFTDFMASFYEKSDTYLHLCHDCCALLFKTFPNATKRFGTTGHHPYDGDEPCCDWGWTVKEIDGIRMLILGNGARREMKP